ncbi:sugar phosphate isomerase/epimerase family protein [Lactonifactor longoviformis]|uniref:sugar phosphate isomerase/epimerase family protein n=1 Tax=Lactonifactor longoviformis TaxID=341220 RepID=UPI0036F37BB0
MKVGAAVGCFTHPHYEPPYEEAVKMIGELGFDGIELIAYTAEDLSQYYTDERCRELDRIIKGYNMELSEFILYAHAVEDLLDNDNKKRDKALEFFERGLETAAKLGTETINVVSNWPKELKAPVPYLPSSIHPYAPGFELFEPKHIIEMPPNFDAGGVWERYVESLSKAVELCEKYKIRFALEGHANVVIGTTDGMLRAFDRISSPYFGTNFDAAWQSMQREYLPWSVYKLREKIFHVHLRDTDGLLCYTYPVGLGIIDWNGFVRALKETGYQGFLSMELGGLKRPEKYIKESLEYIRRILKEEEADE